MLLVQVVQLSDSRWHVEELWAPYRIPVPPDARMRIEASGAVVRYWTAAQWLTDDGCAKCAAGRCVQRIEAHPRMDVVTHDCTALLD